MNILRHLLNLVMVASIVMQPLAAKHVDQKGWVSKQKPKPTQQTTAATLAEWTMLVYIAADNSLASFASYNINDMAAGLASIKGVNVLVQWDQPRTNKTYRYKIVPGGKIDVGSLSSEMGYNVANELVASMQWVKDKFPAKRYALGLWNHGSGIEDFEPGIAKSINNTLRYPTWLPLPGYSAKGKMPQRVGKKPQRGILYDDSQKTCLTNQGLTTALGQIKQIIGHNIDVIFMDACLMAMSEVAYQMKDSVNLFVGSEQTIPGNGFPYSKFIRPLSLNPAGTSALQLAQSMVSSYKQYYTTTQPTQDFTLSAIDVTSIGLIKQNIDQFIDAVYACDAIDSTTTSNMILAARRASIEFEYPECIDLHSFYAAILGQIQRTSPKSHAILSQKATSKPRITTSNPDYQGALDTLTAVIQDGLNKLSTVVLQSAAGSIYAGAQGLSIYYPSTGEIDASYPLTLFAQDTAWLDFIQYYQ